MSVADILVVEDERLVAAALQNELEQFGYRVSGIASSAKEAVQKAQDARPDLVLMDIHLKGLEDGIDAAQQIQATCGVPVVYLSAFFDAATVARAADTQAYGYLIKPYEEQELRTTIEMTLAKHRTERQLEEARRWLAAIYDSIDNAILATDPDNNIHFINFTAEGLTGWRKDQAVGAALCAVCKLVRDNESVDLEELADLAVHESRVITLPAGTHIVSPSGREVPVEGSLAPIYDNRGDYLGTVVALRNITTRLEHERLVRQEEERKRRAQKTAAVGRLSGALAGHLDELLERILGNSSLALAGLVSEAGEMKLVQEIESAAQTAATLVGRLRMFSLLVSDSFGAMQTIDLNLFIPECLNQVATVVSPNIHLSFKPNESVPPVSADELLLGQALFELAANAQDAMPRGGHVNVSLDCVTFSRNEAAAHPERRTGEFVRIRVSDTGRGVPPEIRARLFEPFFTTKDTGHAVGLGLPLVVAVAQQHEGWVECESLPDDGANFDLYLPPANREQPEREP